MAEGYDYKVSTGGTNLSGGQRQRVAIARAMRFGGNILILDEPFKGLDEELKLRIAARLKGRFPLTVIATHDIEEAKLLGDCAILEVK